MKPSTNGPRQTNDGRSRRGDAGFALFEVVVALAVVAITLTAIGALVAVNIRATRALEERLALADTTRLILAGLPNRGELTIGQTSGEISGFRWKLDVRPVDARLATTRDDVPWAPRSVALTVQSPSGRVVQVDTIRLRRGAERPR